MTTGKKTTKKVGTSKEGVTPEAEGMLSKATPAKAKKAAAPKEKAPAKEKAPVKEKAPAKGKLPAKKALVDEDLPGVDEDLAEDLGAVDDDFDLADLESEDEDPVPAVAKKGPAVAKKAPAKAAAADDDDEFGEGEEEEDDLEDEDEDEEGGGKEGAIAAAAKKAAAAAKPKAAPAKKADGASEPEPVAVIPARRLTPEAKAKLNELLGKGVQLNEALRQVAQWETFVAPVREPTTLADRMRPAHRPAAGEPRERESTIDDLDAPPEEEFESSE